MRIASLAAKLLTAAIVAAAFGAAYVVWAMQRPLHPGTETYVVKSGTGLRALANELARRGVIRDTRTFVFAGRALLMHRDVKAGEYLFRDGISARQLIEQVAAGRVVEYPFRIREGATFREVMNELARAPKLVRIVTGLPPEQVMERLGAPGLHPEGRFYPDTYFYTNGSTDLSVLQRAFDAMTNRLRREWDNRDLDLPFDTPDQALTLASIIEKETGKPEERRLIAGVFVNRLKMGMRLQTDPTVIYGMGLRFDGNLRRKDLVTDTPYNTYTRKGLPPTPIAMPSGEAIYAAVHPEKTRALYFVSRGDGSHVFSATLEEHNEAVQTYQLKRRGTARP